MQPQPSVSSPREKVFGSNQPARPVRFVEHRHLSLVGGDVGINSNFASARLLVDDKFVQRNKKDIGHSLPFSRAFFALARIVHFGDHELSRTNFPKRKVEHIFINSKRTTPN